MPIPESGLDYLILSKENAIALSRYFQHQYIHYDDIATQEAVTKLCKFVERIENESSEASGNGVGESRTENEQLRFSGTDWDAKV